MAQLQSTGITGSLNVTGTITAQEFHTEFVSGSIIYSSGSTKFGDTSNDIHSFSGSLQVSGSGNHFFTDGNVGIGTTNPPHKFSVFGTGAGNATVQIEGEGGADPLINFLANNTQHWALGIDDSDSDKFKLSEHSALGTNDYLVVDTSGNVGIGTTSPFFTTSNRVSLSLNGTSSSILAFGKNGSSENYILADAGGFTIANTSTTLPTIFFNNASESMRIDSSGNVGIGTTSPTLGKLVVKDDYIVQTDGTRNVYFGSDGTGGLIGTTTNHYTRFITNNTERIRIDSSGNVGIGTTSIDEKLHVQGNMKLEQSSGNIDLRLTLNGSNKYNLGYRASDDSWGVYHNPGSAYRIFVTGSNGNVGIGTDSPDTKLEIVGADPILTIRDSSTSLTSAKAFLRLAESGASDTLDRYVQVALSGSASGTNLTFDLDGSEKMRINESGNVGVGTTSPANKLTVDGDIGYTGVIGQGSIYGNTANSSYATMKLYNPSTGFSDFNNQSYGYNFKTGGGTKVTILNNGNVGIGVSDPSVELEVGGSTNTQVLISTTNNTGNSQIYFGDSDSDSSGIILYRHSGDSMAFEVGGAERMRVSGSGNVGIGTTSPSEKLEVNGNIGFVGSGKKILADLSSGGTTRTAEIELYNGSNGAIKYMTTNSSSGGHEFYTQGSEKMRISKDGDVGIGTGATIDDKLHVVGTSTKIQELGQTGITMKFNHGNNASVNSDINIANIKSFVSQGSTGFEGGGLTFETKPTAGSATEAMRIDSNGLVGIGTDSPSTVLHLAKPSTEQVLAISGSNGYNASLFMTAAGSGKDARVVVGNSRSLLFDTTTSPTPSSTGTTKMVLTNAGNVGIGTTSPDAILQIANNDGSSYRFGYGGSSDVYLDADNVYIRTDNGGANTATFTTSGLGIGTTSPAQLVSGTERVLHIQNSNVASVNLDSTGTSGNTYVLSSTAVGDFRVYDHDADSVRFLIDEYGSVGIGTTSPDQLLHLQSASATGAILNLETTHGGGIPIYNMKGAHSAQLRYQDENGVNHSRIDFTDSGSFSFIDATNGTSHLYIAPTTGNVGIGTTSPDDLLELTSDGSNAGGAVIRLTHANNNSTDVIGTVNFSNNVGSAAMIQGGTTGANNTGYLSFFTDNAGTSAEKMRILADGNVGIGTTSPSQKLTVVGNLLVASGLLLLENNQDIRWGDAGERITGHNTNGLILTTSNAERMRIDSSGNVGIGTTSPANLLNLSQAAGANIRFDNPTSGNYFIIGEGVGSPDKFSFRGISYQSTDTLTVDFANDRVGIGTHSPGSKLEVAGTIDVNTASSGLPTIKLSHTNSSADNFEIKAGISGVTNGGFSIRDIDASANRFVIDSSGDIGIGTDSPVNNTPLTLQAPSGYTDTLWLKSVGTNIDSRINIGPTGTGNAQINNATGTNIEFQISGTEKMRIDSSGGAIFKGALASHQTNAGAIEYFSNQMSLKAYGATSGTGLFTVHTGGGGGAAGSESMRIDSSGNVLVGKTSTSSAFTTVGVDLRPEGRSFMTRNGGPSLYLNRTTSDGNIVEFTKDSTTVGSIASVATGKIGFFGSGGTGAVIDSSGNVGIGTTSPQALLHVEGVLSASGQITAADIIPYADDTEFLGGTAKRWRILYATRIRTDILREADGTNVLGMTSSTRDLYGLDGNVRISFEDDVAITNGNVGIGTTSPGSSLHIKQSANTYQGGLKLERSDTTAAWQIYTDSSSNLDFNQGATTRGYLVNGVSVANIDFTGQHRSLISTTNDNTAGYTDDDLVGLIVVSDGTYSNISGSSTSPQINEALPNVSLSETAYDKKVYGVISSKEDINDGNRNYAQGMFVTVLPTGSDEQRLIINSVGEGGMWVCDYSGSIENGDYITSSPIKGLGMKQDSAILHNYTVAKITQDCDFNISGSYTEFNWSGSTYRKQFVGVTYHAG